MYKGMLTYIASFIVLLGIWSLILGYFPFLICLLFLLLLIVCFVMSYPAMKQTQIDFKLTSSIIEKDESIQIAIKRHQSSRIICGQVLVLYKVVDAFQECKYKSRVILKEENTIIQIPSHSIGAFHIEIEKVYVYDILQCFSIKRMMETDTQFYVFPHFQFELSHFEELAGFYEDSQDYSPYKKGEDYSEVSDIRTYHETDSLKHIHWKATMKKNELYVKEGSQPIIKKLLLAVKYDASTYAQSLEKYYSVCLSLRQRGIDFEILCPDAKGHLKIELIQSDIYFKECFIKILKTALYPLEETLTSLHGYSDIYLVTALGIEVCHI